ncbi:hypothetical protein E4U45_004045 [Claviceps purpurea]|nr:hypothetical protein E4U45_004045 [Claviceps purpurea]
MEHEPTRRETNDTHRCSCSFVAQSFQALRRLAGTSIIAEYSQRPAFLPFLRPGELASDLQLDRTCDVDSKAHSNHWRRCLRHGKEPRFLSL